MFVPLHWVRDLRIYNQSLYEKLRGAYPEYNWTVKLTDKTGMLFAERTWYNEVDSNILEDIKEIFQTCYQEDSKTLELVEEKLSKLKTK